jgi:hypothetical protein
LLTNAVARHTSLLVDETWTGLANFREGAPHVMEKACLDWWPKPVNIYLRLALHLMCDQDGDWIFLNSWNKGSCWQVPSNELYCFAGWGPSTWFWAMHLQWLRPCDSLSWRKITRSSHSTHHLRKHAGMQRKFTVASPWVLKTSASIGSSIYSLRVCE